MWHLGCSVFLLLFSITAFATPETFVYQGQITKTNGSPLSGNPTTFLVQVLSPTNDCVLYEESHTLNMASSMGVFSLAIGNGTRSGASFEDTSVLLDVFNNSIGNMTGLTCTVGTTYNPAATDRRKIRLTYNDGSGDVTVATDHQVQSIPYSWQAYTLRGLAPSNFLQTNPALNVTQSNLEALFTGGSYANLASLVSGSSTAYVQAGTGGAGMPSFAVDPGTPAAGSVWFNTTDDELKFFDGTTVQTVGVGVATQVSAGAGTAGAPSMSFSSDPDTGWFNPAANTLAATTNGTEKVRITASGNVGIGTTNPGSPLVVSDASGDLFSAYRTNTLPALAFGASGASTRFTHESGRFALYSGSFQIKSRLSHDGGAAILALGTEAPTATAQPFMEFYRATNGAGGTLVSSINNDGGANFGGDVGVGTTAASARLDVRSSSGNTAAYFASTASAASGSAWSFGSEAYSTGTQNMGELWGGWLYQEHGSSGTLNNSTGLYIYSTGNTGGGTITMNRGIHIENQTAGASNQGLSISQSAGANNFAIYSSGLAKSYFAGSVGIGTATPAVSLDLNTKTDAVRIPAGTTAQQPAGAEGMLRYNTTLNKFEVYEDGAWVNMRDPASNVVVTAATGSVGAPSLSFTGEADTGFYGSGLNSIGVSAGGAAIFDFNTVGLVSPTTGGANVLSGNGTEATPTYGFAGDTDTGWFRPAADTMAASTGGTEKMRISATGNVGIGTANPQSLFHIHGTSPELLVRNSATNDGKIAIQNPTPTDIVSLSTTAGANALLQSVGYLTLRGSGASSIMEFQTGGANTRMTIDNVGNVGIGTTTPAAQLQIRAPGTSNAFDIRRVGFEGSQIFTISNLGDITGGAATFTQKLGHMVPTLSATTADASMPAGRFRAAAGQTGSTFEVLRSDASPSLIVTGSGTVGVGTSSPDVALEVATTAESADLIKTSADGFDGVILGLDSLGANHQIGKINLSGSTNISGDRGIGGRITANSASDLFQNNDAVMQFNATAAGAAVATGNTYTFNNNDAAQMIISAGGNLGVGTTSAATSRLKVVSNGLVNNKVLEVNGGGVAGGQVGPFYGMYVDALANNSSTARYGIYALGDGGGGGSNYGIYGTTNMGSSTRLAVGVQGHVSVNSAATNNHPALATPVAGVLATATSTGTSTVAVTTALLARNETQYGSTSYGAFIDAVPGPTTVVPLSVNYNNGELMRVGSSGSVGIGSNDPQAKLDVAGAIKSVAVSNGAASIDFATGNLQYTSVSCGALTLNNMKSGASYKLAVQGAAGGTCSITAWSGSGTGALTVKSDPVSLVQTATKHLVLSFSVMGSFVYVSSIDGY